MAENAALIVSSSPSFGKHTHEPVALLEAHGYEVRLLGRDEPDLLRESLKTADAWIVGFEKVDAHTLEDAPHLRVVAKSGAGLDNFDLDFLREREIRTVSVPGGNARAVAEYTMSQILSLARGTVRNDSTVREGIWRPTIGEGLDGRVLGIIGFGAIGRILAPMAQAFSMRVITYDPYIDSEAARVSGVVVLPLDQVLGSSDFVSLHVPLTADTRYLLDAERIALMKTGSYVINNSRGGVIDEPALHAALSNNHLAGAAIDVFEVEPLALDSPLRDLPNVILSSHTSGYSDTTLAHVTLTCAQRVLDALQE